MTEKIYPLREGVPVTLMGKEYHLSLNLWAGYQAERELERLLTLPTNSVQLLRDFALQTLSMTQLLVLLTCGLQQHHPELTVEAVGKLVHLGQLTTILDTVLSAWNQAMTSPGDAKADGEDTTLSPPSWSGLTSGAAGDTISN